MQARMILITFLFGLLLIGGINSTIMFASAASVTVTSTNDQITLHVKILNVSYMDADEDGFEDDVVAYFDIQLDGNNRFIFDLYLSLVLPSGLKHVYAYTINTRLLVLHCVMYFFDHATESGDYTFTVQIVSFTGGVVTGSVDYVFDPPGGSGDADPAGELVVLL